MWESNLFGYTNSKDFRENIVPYWIEYFFKDPSYLKLDNKPVLSLYQNTLSNFGAKAKEELDYLREACKKADFDGAVILHESRTSAPGALKTIRRSGVDYVYAYTWYGDFSKGGGYQQRCNTRQRSVVANIDGLGMIPSVGNGFDNTAWRARSGFANVMTPAQYKPMLEWLKNDFLPTMPKKELGSGMVLLGNWNEFGEGHFLMPATLAGFDYLDAIREVFTPNAPPSANALPTAAQQQRIDILYPFDWGH
jgi:hypothetical protein